MLQLRREIPRLIQVVLEFVFRRVSVSSSSCHESLWKFHHHRLLVIVVVVWIASTSVEDIRERPMQPVEIVGGEEEGYIIAFDEGREEIVVIVVIIIVVAVVIIYVGVGSGGIFDIIWMDKCVAVEWKGEE